MSRTTLKRGLGALLFMALLAAPAAAIEPQTEEAVVLRNRIYDGHDYKDNFVPSTIDDVYLVDGHDNAVWIIQTLEYYWPLSRQLYVAFDKLNHPLEGTVRITQDGKSVADVGLEDYVVVYPEGTLAGGGRIVWGDEAAAELLHYNAAMTDYSRAVNAAQADRVRYERELKDAAMRTVQGLPKVDVAPPMAVPEPVKLFVTNVDRAYRVNLPPGVYMMDFYQDSLRVVGASKTLRVISPASSSAVTMDVIPEERWTRLLAANTVRDRIFTAPGKAFYVTLNHSDLFDDRDYLRLVSPQGYGEAGRERWVRREPATDADLEFDAGDGAWQRLALTGYKVRQTQGESLGYVIDPAGPDEMPDLSSYAVHVAGGVAASPPRLRIVDKNTGAVLGERLVLVVSPSNPWLLWSAALLPLLAGAGIKVARAVRNRAAFER